MTEEEKKHQKELWKQDRIRARHEEWRKIRSMGAGAKLQYFWDYYKIVLVIAASILLIAYLAVTIIHGSRTRTLLYACFLNADELEKECQRNHNRCNQVNSPFMHALPPHPNNG